MQDGLDLNRDGRISTSMAADFGSEQRNEGRLRAKLAVSPLEYCALRYESGRDLVRSKTSVVDISLHAHQGQAANVACWELAA